VSGQKKREGGERSRKEMERGREMERGTKR